MNDIQVDKAMTLLEDAVNSTFEMLNIVDEEEKIFHLQNFLDDKMAYISFEPLKESINLTFEMLNIEDPVERGQILDDFVFLTKFRLYNQQSLDELPDDFEFDYE
jgi:hypothetical protein